MHGPFFLLRYVDRQWIKLVVAVLATFTLHVAEANSSASNTLTNRQIKSGFNCAKGHSHNEKMICSDVELAQIDYDLMLLYAQAKLATHNCPSFKKANNEQWLWREQHCHDRDCLLQWYANRRIQLLDVLAAHKQVASTSVSVSSSSSTSSISETKSPDADQSYSPSALQPASNSTQETSKRLITFPAIENPLLWIIAIGSVVVAFFIWEMLRMNGQARKRARLIAAAAKNNIDELATQQSQWVAAGSSGMHDPKKWDKEKRRFIEEMIKPALTDCTPLSMTEVDRLCLILDYMTWDVQHANTSYKFRGHLDEPSSSDYLHFCARILREREWKVRTAHANKSDAHLLATRKAMSIVAMCKPQSVPVGSESLREAHELQHKHKARKVVIISNAPFTTSVQKDAEKSEALLLHHFDLSLLASMVEL